MNLRSDIKEFLEITGKSKVKFARSAGINVTLFNLFCNKGYNLSDVDRQKVADTLEVEKQKLKKYLWE